MRRAALETELTGQVCDGDSVYHAQIVSESADGRQGAATYPAAHQIEMETTPGLLRGSCGLIQGLNRLPRSTRDNVAWVYAWSG